MHEMFELGMEWWEFVVRAVAVYVVVLLLTRIIGKRSMGQSTPFDILVIVLLGGIRERLRGADIPAPFRGAPVTLMTTGIIALGFLGFSGLGPGTTF